MTDEIELKLRLPETVAGKKASYTPAKIAAAFGLSVELPKRNQHLVSTYFDTEDEWLRQQGMALRIRQIGSQRVQALKAPTGEVAGAQAFLEIEAATVSDIPDLSLIGDAAVFPVLLFTFPLDPFFSNNPAFTSSSCRWWFNNSKRSNTSRRTALLIV